MMIRRAAGRSATRCCCPMAICCWRTSMVKLIASESRGAFAVKLSSLRHARPGAGERVQGNSKCGWMVDVYPRVKTAGLFSYHSSGVSVGGGARDLDGNGAPRVQCKIEELFGKLLVIMPLLLGRWRPREIVVDLQVHPKPGGDSEDLRQSQRACPRNNLVNARGHN
jgi:hypothetical protein